MVTSGGVDGTAIAHYAVPLARQLLEQVILGMPRGIPHVRQGATPVLNMATAVARLVPSRNPCLSRLVRACRELLRLDGGGRRRWRPSRLCRALSCSQRHS